MADIDSQMDSQEVELGTTSPADVFQAPSVRRSDLLAGKSYSHFSPIPAHIADDMTTECVLGVDEAGRGPVLGRFTAPVSHIHVDEKRSNGLCSLLPAN